MNIRTKNTLGALALCAAMLFMASSCAKEATAGKNDSNKLYFESWMQVHHPLAVKSGLGIYVLDEMPGEGEPIPESDDLYLFVRYTTRNLEGTINGTTEADIDKQLGDYAESNYYGNDIILTSRTSTSAGILEMLDGMRIGGTKTAVIPGWLNVTEDYETEAEYLKKCTGDDMIVTLTVTGMTTDIYAWEIDTLERFAARYMDGVDSTYYGYYYKQLKAPTDSVSVPDDSTFYINYTGRLMNGKVFDTTIADTAKVWGIYSASKTYAPVYIKTSSDYTEVTMSTDSSTEGSELVDGFAYCLTQMMTHEKGIVAFYSGHGYGASGSSPGIPKYAPISFEIEWVDDPEE